MYIYIYTHTHRVVSIIEHYNTYMFAHTYTYRYTLNPKDICNPVLRYVSIPSRSSVLSSRGPQSFAFFGLGLGCLGTLGVRALGLWGLGFRALGLRALGFRALRLRALGLRG